MHGNAEMPNSGKGTGPWRIPVVFIALHNRVIRDYAKDVIALHHICSTFLAVPLPTLYPNYKLALHNTKISVSEDAHFPFLISGESLCQPTRIPGLCFDERLLMEPEKHFQPSGYSQTLLCQEGLCLS